jgi:hypothetical protein
VPNQGSTSGSTSAAETPSVGDAFNAPLNKMGKVWSFSVKIEEMKWLNQPLDRRMRYEADDVYTRQN